MKRKHFIIAGLSLTLGGAGFWFYKMKKPTAPPSPTELAEKLQKERERVAVQQLDTELGRAIFSKNWAQVTAGVADKKITSTQIGDVLRAGFIAGRFNGFVLEDYEPLYTILLSRLESEPNVTEALQITRQWMRMPYVAKLSGQVMAAADSTKILEPVRREIATKIFTQDLGDSAELRRFRERLIVSDKSYGAPKRYWVHQLGQVRAVKVRGALIGIMEKSRQAGKLARDEQAMFLQVVRHHPDFPNSRYLGYGVQALASKDPAMIEAGLGLIAAALPRLKTDDSLRRELGQKIGGIRAGDLSPAARGRIEGIKRQIYGP